MIRPCEMILAALCLLACHTTLTAQEKDIKFHHLTVDDGLPSNTVNAVIRDSRGFVWIASENGIGRYDGYSFTTFRSQETDSLNVSSNIIYIVLEDRQEHLWVGSEKGLDLYNRKLDRFDQHFFSGVPVRAIFQDSKDRLWVGSDHGLHLYDTVRNTFIKPFEKLFDDNEYLYNTIPSITEDREGNLWIGSSNGVYTYNSDTGALIHYLHDKKVPGTLSENFVRRIIQDNKGRIWIATYGGGLNLFLPKTKTFKAYKHSAYDPSGISSDLLPTMWEGDDGKIWIGTDGKGIDIFDPDTGIFHHVVHSPYNSKSLNNNVVRSISSDRRGGVWIGTYNGGINFFNQNAESFFHYKVPTINGNSSVTSFAEEKNGNLWIGTDGGGLCYFNRETGQFANFHHDERDMNSLSDNRIISLLLDHRGSLWIGTYLGGLCRYEPKAKKFVRYKQSDRSGLSDNVIWSLLEDSKQRIWAGTMRGLNIYDPVKDKFTVIDISNSNLSNNMIRCMFEDKKHRLWIGTQEGLNLMEDPSKSFTVIKSDDHKANTLSNHWIRTINGDQQGNVWIGTFSGGLNLFDESSNSFLALGESDGLPDNIVSGILGDDHDDLWISTGRGLAYLEVKTRKFRSYNVSDGLQDYQFNINACFHTKRGEFLFGGNNGFTLFVPDVIKQAESNKYPPRVALTSFKIFNKEVLPNEQGSPLQAQINETKKVTLSHDQSVLTFEFSSLNFIQPEKNQYAYRLVGFEKEWNLVGGKRDATYTNLEPGSYTFQVKASNNDDVWNENGVSLGIEITPPFWGTWWFKVAMGIFACLVALLVVNIVRKRIREKISINKLIAELELKALIAQMNPHFIFNCLTSIQELIIVQKQEEAMHYLNQFSRLLRTVLECSDKNFIALEQEITLLELYLELESMRFDKQFYYSITINDEIDPEEIVIPSFLLQPFVENALWHGLMHKKGDRRLNISFSMAAEDVLLCKITDNGIGRELASKIKSKSIKAYQSMGIRIIRERIAMMKRQNSIFDLKIIDEVDEHGQPAGTTVMVTLPVGENDTTPEKTFEFKREQMIAEPQKMENIDVK